VKTILNLGVEVDFVTGDELDKAMSGLQDSIVRRLPKSRALPIRQNMVGAAVTPASGPTVIILPNTPALGRVWAITHILLTGNDDRTTVAGATAACYRGMAPGGTAQVPDLTGLIFPAVAANTIPLEKAYSNSTIWVHGGENVFAMVYGATAGTSIQLMVEAMDYPDSVMEAGAL
jgi:hypothetical protein